MNQTNQWKYLLPLFGFAAGLSNGFIGAGGGIVCVAALSLLLRTTDYDRKDLYANAIAVMLPVSILSTVLYSAKGSLDTDAFGVFVLPAALGGLGGALLLRRLSVGIVQKIFAVIVIYSGLTMIFR